MHIGILGGHCIMPVLSWQSGCATGLCCRACLLACSHDLARLLMAAPMPDGHVTCQDAGMSRRARSWSLRCLCRRMWSSTCLVTQPAQPASSKGSRQALLTGLALERWTPKLQPMLPMLWKLVGTRVSKQAKLQMVGRWQLGTALGCGARGSSRLSMQLLGSHCRTCCKRAGECMQLCSNSPCWASNLFLTALPAGLGEECLQHMGLTHAMHRRGHQAHCGSGR